MGRVVTLVEEGTATRSYQKKTREGARVRRCTLSKTTQNKSNVKRRENSIKGTEESIAENSSNTKNRKQYTRGGGGAYRCRKASTREKAVVGRRFEKGPRAVARMRLLVDARKTQKQNRDRADTKPVGQKKQKTNTDQHR